MKALLAWLDHRTGCKKFLHEALYENVPGGARWRYVWGSTLTFALVIQIITGLFLWMAYSPSSQTAWESVFYIQYQMAGGWLLRGLHHFTAQLMTAQDGKRSHTKRFTKRCQAARGGGMSGGVR